MDAPRGSIRCSSIPAHPTFSFSKRGYGLSLRLADGTTLEAAEAYISLHGCLAIDGAECPIAQLDQEAVLALVRDRLAPGEELDAFILGGVRDPALQATRTAALRADAVPFAESLI